MDQIIKKIAVLGVPGLVLMVAINLTGLVGAAAITTALSAIGPGGIIGGVITLCAIAVISDAIAEYGFDAIAKGVVKELLKNGETKASIKEKISRYPVTTKMKATLYDTVDKYV